MTLLIIFILASSGRWEFSNIEWINATTEAGSHLYCEHLARAARDHTTRAYCVVDEGVEL